MPQLNPGGKFIFGWSVIAPDGRVRLPEQAVREYGLAEEKHVYLFTGSGSTGGFCVTRKGLLGRSRLSHILEELPQLKNYTGDEGAFLPYKGRSYCWTPVTGGGELILSEEMRKVLGLSLGGKLLSIRSSDIAFTMGAKGPLLERAEGYLGEIPVY